MKKRSFSQAVLVIFMFLIAIVIAVPFVSVISISFSNEKDIVTYGFSILPRSFDLSAYKYIFANPKAIMNAYGVTAFFSVVGTVLSVALMSMIAYPLSKKYYKPRNAVSFYIFFTMLFSGGMVPSYILITRYLHMMDSVWVYIIPGLVAPWYIFMLRTFFQGLPDAISESAFIDGADEFRIFYSIILPMSKPALATCALLIFLGKWNDWYTTVLYINRPSLYSLQYLLQKMMSDVKLLQETAQSGSANRLVKASAIPTETVKMAMAVVVAGPAVIIFPFFQKYFVKGMTIGSVKG